MRRILVTALAALAATPAVAAQRFNYDALGAEFCRLSVAGDRAGLRPLLTAALNQAVDAAAGRPQTLPPQVLFQSYTNVVPECTARTRNAALVEIDRSKPGGAPPSWTEYLVIVPEADGVSRIDDVLFATRRSDTLRARLEFLRRVALTSRALGRSPRAARRAPPAPPWPPRPTRSPARRTAPPGSAGSGRPPAPASGCRVRSTPRW